MRFPEWGTELGHRMPLTASGLRVSSSTGPGPVAKKDMETSDCHS